MRNKRKPRLAEVEEIKGMTSAMLVEKCPDGRAAFPRTACTNDACPYSISKLEYLNCSFVAAEASSRTDPTGFSLEEIGEALGITREGVRLIEVRGLKKIRAAALALGLSADDLE